MSLLPPQRIPIEQGLQLKELKVYVALQLNSFSIYPRAPHFGSWCSACEESSRGQGRPASEHQGSQREEDSSPWLPGKARALEVSGAWVRSPHTFSAGQFACLPLSPSSQVHRDASSSLKKFVTQDGGCGGGVTSVVPPVVLLSLRRLTVPDCKTLGAPCF